MEERDREDERPNDHQERDRARIGLEENQRNWVATWNRGRCEPK